MANPTDPKPADEKRSQNDKGNNAVNEAKSGNTSDEDDSKCVDDDNTRQLPDFTVEKADIEAVEEEHDMPNDVVEQEGTRSWPSLTSTNLSMDARACRMPRRRPTGALTAKDKLGDKPAKDKLGDKLGSSEFDFKKDTEFDEKLKKDTKKSKDLSEIETFIKNLVRNRCTEIKIFDAAIVYDKNDFESVTDFRQELIFIAQKKLKEDLRIELFDSEKFSQSKIMVVEDVLQRCSVVLVYLTSNFTSPELNLFIEEAVGMSRLGLGSEQFSSQKQWVLKPVHTMSRKSRGYKTPVGLITVNGIDWFDRSSSHTMNQIITMLQSAIVQRKQREIEGNTSQNYKQVFGSVPEMPVLGPPFNKVKPHRPPGFKISHSPLQPRTAQFFSNTSNDVMSLTQGSPVFSPLQNNPTAIRTDTQPSFTPDVRNVQYGDARHLNVLQNSSPGGRYAHESYSFNMNTPKLEPRNQPNAYPPYDMPPPYSPRMDRQVTQSTIGEYQLSQPFPHNIPAPQPGYVYQSAGLSNQGIPNYQTSAMPAGPTMGVPVRLDMQQSQMPVYPGNMSAYGAGPYDSYQSQHISRDALRSEPGNFLLDQRNDTPPTSQLSVVSQVSGNLITKTNLSADDDVEIDTRSQNDHVRNFANDFENSTDESDYTSDSDSDMDFTGKGRVVQKVVNIVGCETVQLGKGNRVKTGSKQETTDKPSKNRTKKCDRPAKDSKITAASIDSNLRTARSNSAENISVSEDNMSAENALSRDSHYNLEDRYSSGKKNMLSTDAYRFEPGKSTKNRINTKLKVQTEREIVNEEKTKDVMEVYSPDDNISEDQLFGSGSLSLNSPSSYNIHLSSEAPFSFSQGIQQTRDFMHMLLPSLNMNKVSEGTLKCKTNCVNNDVD